MGIVKKIVIYVQLALRALLHHSLCIFFIATSKNRSVIKFYGEISNFTGIEISIVIHGQLLEYLW
jgi:hypothetical protein